jgi:hypothetical protein
VTNIFMAMEQIAGKRLVSVTERRTRVDWAIFMKGSLDDHYPNANKVVLVMDNLSAHGIASFYKAFPSEETSRLASRLEIHFTPHTADG